MGGVKKSAVRWALRWADGAALRNRAGGWSGEERSAVGRTVK